MKNILIALLFIIPGITFADARIITLDRNNSVSLRDSVNWTSVSQLQYNLLRLSTKLDNDDVIYLVLDTPGGSVMAGEMLNETIKSIPQKVHVIVLFAASMGFQITQAAHTRFITENGVLMSHRATVRLQGQMDGELESRLAFYKASVKVMEVRSSNRIGITLDEYKDRIINEWWEFGSNAVTAKMADEVVVIKCSESLVKGTVYQTIMSIFGSRTFQFSRCPLITTPISKPKNDRYEDNNKLLDLYLHRLYYNKRDFINNYIKTGLITL